MLRALSLSQKIANHNANLNKHSSALNAPASKELQELQVLRDGSAKRAQSAQSAQESSRVLRSMPKSAQKCFKSVKRVLLQRDRRRNIPELLLKPLSGA